MPERDSNVAARVRTQHLLLADALATHGSMLRAAGALNMSQPACSKLLHQLELLTGGSLFTRHVRGMAPTAEGEAFVRHARAALREIRQAGEAVAALRAGMSGTIRLGTEATSATGLVPRAIALLQRRTPGVVVAVELAFSERLVRGVLDRSLDVAIARLGSRADEAALRHESLPPAPHVLAAGVGHDLIGGRSPGWPRLLEQSWVLPPEGNVMKASLALFLRQRGLDLPRRVVETAALPVTVALLQEGAFIAPLPRAIVPPVGTYAGLRRLPVTLPLDLPHAAIVTRRETPSPVLAALLDCLRTCTTVGQDDTHDRP